MSKQSYKDLDYNEYNNLFKIINESPFMDKNGVKFIPLSTRFLSCYLKSILIDREIDTAYTDLLFGMMNQIISYTDSGVNVYNIENDQLRHKVREILHLNGRAKKSKLVLCTEGLETEFDVESACTNLIDYSQLNPKDKYVLPHSVNRAIKVYSDGKRTSTIKAYDFYNNFNYDEYMNDIKLSRSKGKGTCKVNPVNSECQNVQTQKFTNTLDKFVLDDNMTFKQMNEVFEFINNAISFFDKQGINWRKKLNFSTSYIDDTCGYPIVKDIDDIPSPFPEEIEGDEKLANL